MSDILYNLYCWLIIGMLLIFMIVDWWNTSFTDWWDKHVRTKKNKKG